MSQDKLLYLSWEELDSLGVTQLEIINACEKAFVAKGNGKVSCPPKHWHQTGPATWFGGMSCYIKDLDGAGIKWQSGNPENAKHGRAFIQGFYILNKGDGLPISVMNSTWITGKRTACASALTAKYLAKKDSKTLAICGCGLQGRAHLEAMKAMFPSLTTCMAYDIFPAATEKFCKEMSEKVDIKIIPAASAKEAVADADIVVTAGPICSPAQPGITDMDWLKPGVTVVTIDYDSYLSPEVTRAFDYIVTDDIPQTEHTKESGFFTSIDKFEVDLADVIVGNKPGRVSDNQKILAFNLGVAIEDLPTAQMLYKKAVEKGVGTYLPF